MEIKVTDCYTCPFVYHSGCDADLDLVFEDGTLLDSVHQDCPLKKENITVSLEEKTTQETIDKRNHHLLTHNRKK